MTMRIFYLYISRNSTRFDTLVLDEDKKVLLHSLILNKDTPFNDIIRYGYLILYCTNHCSGKGGGLILLLHGAPGSGKTLTAEAIAESLHRPLYAVSVGELGTNTEILETKLKDILEIASTWNSITLLDEADIFLEKRHDNDVMRNAMVGIFLRLLEYYQGILFLTTNRVKTFDEAFHSRISVALKYRDLDTPTRVKVWNNLFSLAGSPATNLTLTRYH